MISRVNDKGKNGAAGGNVTVTIIRTIADTTWRIFAPVVVFLIIGIIIDKACSTAPLIMLIGAVFGFAVSIVLVWMQIRHIQFESGASTVSDVASEDNVSEDAVTTENAVASETVAVGGAKKVASKKTATKKAAKKTASKKSVGQAAAKKVVKKTTAKKTSTKSATTKKRSVGKTASKKMVMADASAEHSKEQA